jgi:hypothetical protein
VERAERALALVDELRAIVSELWANPHPNAARAKARQPRRLELVGEAFARQRDVTLRYLQLQDDAQRTAPAAYTFKSANRRLPTWDDVDG